MTKEELTRIKQAYYSGLKVQIWFNGYWENFDARDYSMYSDPFSENRQYRIIGSDYADIAEKHIAELEKENADLKAQIEKMKCCENCRHSDTECEGHTICTIGHFYECLGNKIFDHTSDEKDYWEENENG